MTREEIIKGLEDYIPWADEYEVDIEVLKGALELLKQEPCDDAISRQAVHYYIESHINEIITESGVDKNEHTNRILRTLVNGVDTMPSVTPTKRVGSWYIRENGFMQCSKCQILFARPSVFCPNCGADMRGDNNDLGDYPDTIPNQFDNMTGSMNL